MTDAAKPAAPTFRAWLKAHELTLMYALIAVLVVGGYALIENKASQQAARLCEASKANRNGLVAQIEQVTALGKNAAAGAPPSKELTAYLHNLDNYRTESLKALPPLGENCEEGPTK
jgi:hypothetical protein